MKWIVATVVIIATPVQAQHVYKCMDEDKRASYQSAPCDAGQRTLKQWDAIPDPVAAAAPSRASAPTARKNSRSRGRADARGQRPRGAAIPAENNGNSSACVSAKQQRKRTLDQVGLKRTYALLRQLDDAVWRACN